MVGAKNKPIFEDWTRTPARLTYRGSIGGPDMEVSLLHDQLIEHVYLASILVDVNRLRMRSVVYKTYRY